MLKHLLPTLALTLVSLAACGGEDSGSTGSPNTGGAGVPTLPSGDGHLEVTIDGTKWVCEGRIKNDGMTVNKKDLHLVLIGKVPADGDRPATELHVVLVKKTRADGRYDLVSNQVSLDVMEGDLAYVKIFALDQALKIEGRKGSLTFTKLTTTEEGFRNYGVLHAAGTFEGTFGKGDKTHQVSGSFEFIRR
jgi:hypothetical protein